MNKYQEEIKLKVSLGKGKDYVARYLSSIGQDLNEEINERMDGLRKDFPKADFFYLAIAESLAWNKYALDKKAFFKRVIKYYQDEDTSALDEIERFSGRYGEGRLKETLISWKRIFNQTPVPSYNKQPKISNLISVQKAIKDTVEQAKARNRMTFGAWLLTAPFQIIACYYKKLWEDSKLDEVLMPLGGQVKRGLSFLIKINALNISRGLVKSIGYEDFSAQVGRLEALQEEQKKLAKLAKSRVLHINSGLYRLGARGEE